MLDNTGSSPWCSVTTWKGGMEWGVGGRFKREWTYGWFMLFYGRNQHNIVKQLSSSLKKKKIMRKTCKYPISIFLLWSAVFAKALSFMNNSDQKKKKKTKTPLPINFWSCTNVKKKNKEATNVGKNVNKRKRSSCKKKFLELWRV